MATETTQMTLIKSLHAVKEAGRPDFVTAKEETQNVYVALPPQEPLIRLGRHVMLPL